MVDNIYTTETTIKQSTTNVAMNNSDYIRNEHKQSVNANKLVSQAKNKQPGKQAKNVKKVIVRVRAKLQIILIRAIA